MKNNFLLLCLLILHGSYASAQSVGIGTASPDASAQLHIASNTKGLLLPRMTGTAMAAINSPAKGLLVYDSVANQLKFNAGTKSNPNWRPVGSNTGNQWGLSGNAGTNPANHFIGTTDNTTLAFRINNIAAGRIDSALYYTSMGFRAGHITTGKYTTAFGYYALSHNTSGEGNTAMGYKALSDNSTGVFNTAIGVHSLSYNTQGNYNTAMGFNTLTSNTTGSYNVASGRNALVNNTTGGYNVASGYNTMFANVEGGGNVALGYGALQLNIISNYNTAIGSEAGGAFSPGWNNTFVGSFSNLESTGLFNCVAVGNAATVFADNQVRIGNSVSNSIGGYANWTNLSDGRFKKNIQENVKGLAFIMQLRPVTYQLDMAALNHSLHETKNKSWNEDMQKAATAKEQIIQTGFVAQEVETAAQKIGYDFSGVDKPKNNQDFYGLRYAEFVVPLVKALQEQQMIIEQLTAKIDALEKAINKK